MWQAGDEEAGAEEEAGVDEEAGADGVIVRDQGYIDLIKVH